MTSTATFKIKKKYFSCIVCNLTDNIFYFYNFLQKFLKKLFSLLKNLLEIC